MILAFDVGNTFVKWGFVHDGLVVGSGRVVHRGRALAAALAEVHVERRATRVVAVNVAGAEAASALARWARTTLALDVRFVDALSPCPGMLTLYREPARLGADRWAAAVGGFTSYGACIIADLGTAATVDAVGAEGVHRGGYIVPGLDAMRLALASGTQAVQVEDREVAPGVWGRDTAEAVAAGARRGLAALIESVARELGPTGAKLVITGGDADRVAPWLNMTHRIDHELVLRGACRLAEHTT